MASTVIFKSKSASAIPANSAQNKCTTCHEIVNTRHSESARKDGLYRNKPTKNGGASKAIDFFHFDCTVCDICGLHLLEHVTKTGTRQLKAIKVGNVICHPACFCCAQCEETIVDSTFDQATRQKRYFLDDNQFRVINGLHYHNECVTCESCGGSGHGVRVYPDGRTLHAGCRLCSVCETKIGMEPIIDDHVGVSATVTHKKCIIFGKCHGCSKAMVGDDHVMSTDGNHYHYGCVECSGCCRKGKFIAGQTGQFLIFKGSMYHSDCIPCKKCHVAIGGHYVDPKTWAHKKCPQKKKVL